MDHLHKNAPPVTAWTFCFGSGKTSKVIWAGLSLRICCHDNKLQVKWNWMIKLSANFSRAASSSCTRVTAGAKAPCSFCLANTILSSSIFRHTHLQCPHLWRELDSWVLQPSPSSLPAAGQWDLRVFPQCCWAAACWSCLPWRKPPSLHCCCCCSADCVCWGNGYKWSFVSMEQDTHDNINLEVPVVRLQQDLRRRAVNFQKCWLFTDSHLVTQQLWFWIRTEEARDVRATRGEVLERRWEETLVLIFRL